MARIHFFVTLADEADGSHVLARLVDQGFKVGPMPPSTNLYTRSAGSSVVLAMMLAEIERPGDRSAYERMLPPMVTKACQGLSVLSAVAQLMWGSEPTSFAYVPVRLETPAATGRKGAKPSEPTVYDKIGE